MIIWDGHSEFKIKFCYSCIYSQLSTNWIHGNSRFPMVWVLGKNCLALHSKHGPAHKILVLNAYAQKHLTLFRPMEFSIKSDAVKS